MTARLALGGVLVTMPEMVVRRSREAVHEQERRFRELLEALPAAVYTTDAKGRITFFNEAAVKLAGRQPRLGDMWCVSWKLFYPDGMPMPHDKCPMALALKEDRPIREVEAIAERPDGTRVHFMPFPTPLHDKAGNLVGGVNMLIDITHRKRAEERLVLLAREVDHRANNLLAVVQATAQLTHAGSVEEYKKILTGRIHALAHAHALLSDSRWVGADLRRLIDEELQPYCKGEQRMVLDGPSVTLDPQLAQSLAVALHELATNAARYGSLSAPIGKVHVAWRRVGDSELALRWSEQNGPKVNAPASRGFGTGAVERMLRSQLKGDIRYDWRPEGLVCEITLPFAEVKPLRAHATT